MTIKILGGIARGFPLAAPKTLSTRPTSVLVRRRLFDWRQNLEGHVFVDLFAGSGAMGLEALSRGADRVILNDSMRPALATLRQNSEHFLRSFRLESDRVKVSGLDALKWLERELSYELQDPAGSIIFLDPPYEEHALYADVLGKLRELGFAGEVWVEADRLKGPKKELIIGAFSSVIKAVEHGDHFVVVGKVV